MSPSLQALPMGALDDRAWMRLREALDTLVPSGAEFSIARWTERLEAFLCKKIYFLELPLPAGYFGARVSALPARGARQSRPIEVVVTAAGLVPIMREHVTAHELAHITLGHRTVILTARQLLDLRADISTLCWHSGATCRVADPAREQEPQFKRDMMAETLARLAEKRHMEVRLRSQAAGFSSDAAMDRLIRSLSGD